MYNLAFDETFPSLSDEEEEEYNEEDNDDCEFDYTEPESGPGAHCDHLSLCLLCLGGQKMYDRAQRDEDRPLAHVSSRMPEKRVNAARVALHHRNFLPRNAGTYYIPSLRILISSVLTLLCTESRYLLLVPLQTFCLVPCFASTCLISLIFPGKAHTETFQPFDPSKRKGMAHKKRTRRDLILLPFTSPELFGNQYTRNSPSFNPFRLCASWNVARVEVLPRVPLRTRPERSACSYSPRLHQTVHPRVQQGFLNRSRYNMRLDE